MPQGRPSSDDPTGPETVRGFPSNTDDPGIDEFSTESRFSPPLSDRTELKTPSEDELYRQSMPDTRPSDEVLPSSAAGLGSGSSSGSSSDGAFLEKGVVAVEPGQVVFGKYLVVKRLGRGGMGEVWLVRDTDLDVERALKMITQGTAFDSDARARFRREARAMAQFSHPNVVTVHDSRLDRRDIAYIVMEYVPGESLEKFLQPGVPMPLDWTFRVLTQLCEALQVAHRRGIIHRDLKPSNLMLVADEMGGERLKVLDFGIAKILRSDDAPPDLQTVVGAFMGTPPYASPEQANGHAEPLSDIYSVGVILYEFLTGYRPFRGKPAQVIAKTVFSAPPPFAESNPEVNLPPEIEKVVLRCLAKTPEERPQSPMALLEEFKAAMPRAGDPIPTGTGPLTGPTLILPVGRKPRDLRTIGWVAAAVLGIVIVAALVAGLRREKNVEIVGPSPAVPPKPPLSKPLKPEITWNDRPFVLWNKKVYLPKGYEPADPTDVDEEGYPNALVRSDSMKFFRIPGGDFLMGARGKLDVPESDADATNLPTRPVKVAGFYLQRTEATNAELKEYEAGLAGDSAGLERWRVHYDRVKEAYNDAIAARHPAREVSWKLASEFARKKGGWLPAEAQWEFAARSRKTSRALVWDEEKGRENPIEQLANIFKETKDGVWTASVGDFRFDRTDQGVMDMAGNVREWCRDPWLAYAEMSEAGPPALPDDPSPTTEVVARGGSFNLTLDSRFITHRNPGVRVSDKPPDIGFRMVLECPPPSAGR